MGMGQIIRAMKMGIACSDNEGFKVINVWDNEVELGMDREGKMSKGLW